MDLALVIDTTSRYSDIWPMYFGQLNRFFPQEISKYLFVDECSSNPIDNLIVVKYDNNDSYRNQFLNCLRQVKEPYIVYNSEDYILYNKVFFERIYELVEILKREGSYRSFVKLIKGPESTFQYGLHPHLHIIDDADSNLFAQQVSIWRTDDLIRIFEYSHPNNGRMQQEPGGSAVCRRLDIHGLQYFKGIEKKRGIYHYDSDIFPSIATAIVKGKWNINEYSDILPPLVSEYNIDTSLRGVS